MVTQLVRGGRRGTALSANSLSRPQRSPAQDGPALWLGLARPYGSALFGVLGGAGGLALARA